MGHVAGPKARNSVDLRIAPLAGRVGGERARQTAINGTVPGPLLRFREGEEAVLRVTNGLNEDTSIHWHGLLLPYTMDGVPGLSFDGIPPGETFEYRFPIIQSGTYWYHSHSGLQEQLGVYAPLIIDPAHDHGPAFDREFVIVLSDWTFENPYKLLDNLIKDPTYYNYQRRTFVDLVEDGARQGLGQAIRSRLMWKRMRMDATDISDVTGATYTYLMNGHAPGDNWTGIFQPGERIRLRFINAGSATFFDVRIPGLPLTVIQADGQDVQPVDVEEFRIAPAETYDVLVSPGNAEAYTVFAEAMDRSGFAAGMLATHADATAHVPNRRKRPVRSMADMGHADHGAHSGDGQGAHGAAAEDPHAGHATPPAEDAHAGHATPPAEDAHAGHAMPPAQDAHAGHAMPPADPHAGHAMADAPSDLLPAGTVPPPMQHGPEDHGSSNAGVPGTVTSRLHEPGVGLGSDGWRVLTYADLRAVHPHDDAREPGRELELHITGNMERYMWSFDGKAFSEVTGPMRFEHGERLRLTLVNDTMMEHPIHLHGMWMVLENGTGDALPRKHTVNVKPAERLSVLVTADAPGLWAFHCHILYHMEMGMFRVVQVADSAMASGDGA